MNTRNAYLAAVFALGVGVTVFASTAGWPSWWVVVGFGCLVIASENSPVVLHQGLAVSPTILLIMASLPVLAGTNDGEGLLLGVALIAACGSLDRDHIQGRRWDVVAVNAGSISTATVAAACFFQATQDLTGVEGLLAILGTAITFEVVNTALILPAVSMTYGEPVRVLWSQLRPTIPNSLSFSVLGLLVGKLAAKLGPGAAMFAILPLLIGRWTFATFLRLQESQESALRVFVRLTEAKDAYTAGHVERVATFAVYVGEELGLDPNRIEHLRRSALLHDVGKLAVPSRLLNKPGRLTPDEWDVVKRHNEVGVGILGRIDFLRETAVTASDKHGHFDAPDEDTPAELILEAHIVSVADAFDAMTSTRSYRRALEQDVAFDELRKNSGTQFNPECAEALIRAIERRGEHYGAGFETDAHDFAVPPPVTGVGSAGLGDLAGEAEG